jgi:hypothetical protein
MPATKGAGSYTMLSCITVEPTCPAARDGTANSGAPNSNTRVMTYVDVDSDDKAPDSNRLGDPGAL